MSAGADDAARQVEAAALRSDRFRLEREPDWKRLEALVRRMERGWGRRLADDEVMALPALYRTAVSSLSIARESSLDAGLIRYLETLTLRAYLMVYGPRTGLWRWLGGFLAGGWSRAVRALWPDIAATLLAMLAGVALGWLLVDSDPAWFYRLIDAGLAGGRDPEASTDMLRQSLFDDHGGSGFGFFAASLFSNNAQVAILAFALGFAFGVPSLLLVVHNLAGLGALWWVFAQKGLGTAFLGWIAIHGTTELSAILLAGAAGVHVGRSIALPGRAAVLDAASAAGRRTASVMVGVILMLVLAALLEGFGRQMIQSTPLRYAIGGVLLLGWISYFALAGRARR